MTLTYNGKPAFADWADNPAVQFGQLLIRLSLASRTVGDHDAKLARMDNWLAANPDHPLYQDRQTKRHFAHIKSDELRAIERDQMNQAAYFLRDHCPALHDHWHRLHQLITQYGGQFPADPGHRGDPLRRIPWNHLADPDPPF